MLRRAEGVRLGTEKEREKLGISRKGFKLKG